MSFDCKRGEIYLVNFDPARGSEQAGERPAMIIQNDTGNLYSPTTIVAACSTAPNKSYPFMFAITAKESGLEKDSFVNLAQIVTIDKSRLIKKIGLLPASKIIHLNNAIINSLGLY
ncbi:MAG: type II toxin-antitoxin system PemK/MazF family toxin [Dehalococcoidia bacterium]|nr:MAG: type II toxin-antitoxin system PemK/MazF family toxin [Dehalococcoidia bacterium]